ncbi:hypothetical protein I302_108072 [Kwoniella bestiolae CBS 10118]|uniref:Uncharacterized protein n=1 Tax=Kwoniella bestiolae CBS 10118 TaxID=1296100 RepID=A0A1B9FWR4_9TREE|nr:hypothetical protein I302_07562 [Kwoniella bestiolae CBS 10118]OCF23208.1 hypothetical protein I302_07562 [Kwoniella bestiolae CBS 10118]
MSKPPPAPTNSKKHHRPRSSSLSLSIARSPSVLSSGLFFPASPHPIQDDEQLEDEISHHPNVYGVHAHPYGNPMRRVISAGGAGKLDIINDEEIVQEGSTSVPHLPIHSLDTSPKIAKSLRIHTQDNDEEEIVEDENDHDDTSRPLLPTRKVSFQPVSSNDIHAGQDRPSDGEVKYEGPFQPPDSKELLSIIFSVVGVTILAVAAGCTTIFDWVL